MTISILDNYGILNISNPKFSQTVTKTNALIFQLSIILKTKHYENSLNGSYTHHD